MIQAMIKVEFSLDRVDDALRILGSLLERIRAEAGCISCSVYHDMEKEQGIVFTEEWRSEEDLQRHLRSDQYQEILLVMEMAVARPEIRFNTITSSNGVEIIEKARTGK